MRLAYYAGQRHFVDHLAPIWAQTGGAFHVPTKLARHARTRGVTDPAASMPRRTPTVVASFGDYKKAVLLEADPIVLVNHGAGQTFTTPHGSYSGGPNRDRVSLFIEPNETAARATRNTYPDAQVVVVGSPKLDVWDGFVKPRDDPPTLAVSFHWDCHVVPETRTAWPHWRNTILKLGRRFRLLGHGHPKIMPTLAHWYRQAGVEVVEDFDEVMRRADLYLCDGVSTLYEFAATDRPVVVLNAPWFRRDVEHGLRFWRYANVGVQVDHPKQLDAAVDLALEDPPRQRQLRAEAVLASVGQIDGKASFMAAEAIRRLVDG